MIMNNRKLVIYSSVGAAFLLAAVVYLFSAMFSKSKESTGGDYSGVQALYRAIPSDAVAVLSVDKGSMLLPLAGTGDANTLPALERERPATVSLHYSSKNEVSLLWVSQSASEAGKALPPVSYTRKRGYNGVDIYEMAGGTALACYGELTFWSRSPYVVEGAIRHLKNETSILDSPEFLELAKKSTGAGNLMVNHHQIGKLFSGVVQREFLKYSDFFLRLTSWSLFEIKHDSLFWDLAGGLVNYGEVKYYSSLFSSQSPKKMEYSLMLPARTAFAVSVPFSDTDLYLERYKEFLEVHKKLGDYSYRQHLVTKENSLSPAGFVDSLDVREAVAAFCSFGGRYDWVTLLRSGKGEGFISGVISGMLDRDKEVAVEDFVHKGYIGSVFGSLFGHCNEESFCRAGNWVVVGPSDFVKAFAVGANKFFTLNDYLSAGALNGFFDKESNLDVYLNVSFARDSVLNVFKPEYSAKLGARLDSCNFAVVTARFSGGDSQRTRADVRLYAAKLDKLPEPPASESEEIVTVTDSTIVVDNTLFELKDFVNGGKCYLRQNNNLSLSYLNGKKKSVWTIPFNAPLCGRVEQVDFFSNNKLQMLACTSDKLYLIDRLGRNVKGFPMQLHKSVVLGPEVFEEDEGYGFVTLNRDNTISLYKLSKNGLDAPVNINAGEFVRELPAIKRVDGESYLFVKCVSQIKIYSLNGNQITGKEKKRKIAPDSELEFGADGVVYTGTDKKRYIIDLKTGKSSLKKK